MSSFNFGSSSGFKPGSSTTPSFGFGSTPTASTTPSFGFGASASTPQKPAFGFGASTQPTATPSSFGFGATTPATSTSSFSFSGQTANQQQSAFGAKPSFSFPTSSAASSFSFNNQPAQTATTSLFGQQSGGFGSNQLGQTSQPSQFGFGQTSGQFSFPGQGGIGANQQQVGAGGNAQGNKIPVNPITAQPTAFPESKIFNDARDEIINEFNKLQAMCGKGRLMVGQGQPLIEVSSENPYCKFKKACYVPKPSVENQGKVGLLFNLDIAKTLEKKEDIMTLLKSLFTSSPNIQVVFDSVQGLNMAPGQERSEIIFYVVSTIDGLPGSEKRISSEEVSGYIRQNAAKLGEKGVVDISPRFYYSDQVLDQLLQTCPPGFNPLDWHFARKDNPYREKLMPQPVSGFEDLATHFEAEKISQREQCNRLNAIILQSDDVHNGLTRASARLEILKRKRRENISRCMKLLAFHMATRPDKMEPTIEEIRTLKKSIEMLKSNFVPPTAYYTKILALNKTIGDRLARELINRDRTSTAGGEMYVKAEEKEKIDRFTDAYVKYTQVLENAMEKLRTDLNKELFKN